MCSKADSEVEAHAVQTVPRFRCVLFICAANTARSVMAEYMLRHELEQRGIHSQVRVCSAGIAPYARDGALVSLDARLALRAVGIDAGEEAASTDLKRHPELLDQADVVIAMTSAQARELRRLFPRAAGKPVHTLYSFVGEEGDIEDPSEKGDEVFAAVRAEIGRLIPVVADRILGLAPRARR